ncbi:MAG: integrating conjugative element protein, partial [Alphaproteobacteria bacterium]|nr:integrating conjugative element protein [Alphaproteobacteria bacterium]
MMKTTALLMSIMLIAPLHSAIFPTQSDYYYQLGGASDLFIPPVNREETITIGGNINAGRGLNCSQFSPVVSITNTFKDLKESATGIPATVINNLKGSVGAFPMYKLQQAMPGLYNILQNAAAGAQNEFALKMADCQQVKKTLEEGNSPITSMLSVSDSQGWIDAATRARHGEAVDINKTAKNIANKGSEYGLPWVHRGEGNSGGKFQKPIKVINDVVIAGYNLMLTSSRNLDDTTAPESSFDKENAFVKTWPNPNAAAHWAVMVLGDIQVSAREEGSAKDAKVGLGLTTLLQSCPKIA